MRVRGVPGNPERHEDAYRGPARDRPSAPEGLTSCRSEGRYERGKKLLARIAPEQERILKETYDPINPDIVRYVIAFGYGDIYARGLLSLRDRQVATIAALAAKGTAPSQLRFHIGGWHRAGLSEAEIVEIMLLISVYAGFPAALNGILTTQEVAASMKKK